MVRWLELNLIISIDVWKGLREKDITLLKMFNELLRWFGVWTYAEMTCRSINEED